MFPERFVQMPFIRKNFIQFIYKEKSGAVTKLKRNQKFKKHNELYFGTFGISIIL